MKQKALAAFLIFCLASFPPGKGQREVIRLVGQQQQYLLQPDIQFLSFLEQPCTRAVIFLEPEILPENQPEAWLFGLHVLAPVLQLASGVGENKLAPSSK